jgi:hypothetical protein
MSWSSFYIADQTGIYDTPSDGSGSTMGWIILNGTTMRITTTRTPSSSSDVGKVGEMCWDSNYLYVAVASNTWKRVALSSF